jgi:hypothetical protein
MFEQLDQNKIMYFKDGTQQKFVSALVDLSEQLGRTGLLDIVSIEDDLMTSLNKEAMFLMTGKNFDADAHEFLVTFHRWAMNIHDGAKLANAPGLSFPINIIFDMKKLLIDNPTPHNALMRLFFEGFNGRKICKGDTPTVEFISSILLVEALQSVPKPLSVAGRDFLAQFDTLSAFTETQQLLSKGIQGLSKSSPMYAFLAGKDVFKFVHTINPETGANSYDMKKSFDDACELLKQYPADKLQADLEGMATDIQTMLAPFLQSFDKVKATPTAKHMALWDASEWACIALVAVQVAAEKNVNCKAVLNSLIANPTMAEAYNRSLTGNFAVNARNEAVKHVEVAEIYLQHDISLESRPKIALKA